MAPQDAKEIKEALTNDCYTVGWICAVKTEYVAAQLFLDEKHGRPHQQAQHDGNDYTLGQIGKHNVVIATLPGGEYGTSAATGVAKDMMHSFPNVRIGLMVGIAGGAPNKDHDIRLGDIVVGMPDKGESGVIYYDFGKLIQNQALELTGHLDKPPTILRTAVTGLQAEHDIEGHAIEDAVVSKLRNARLRKNYGRPDPKTDKLYQPTFEHHEKCCAEATGDETAQLVHRDLRDEDEDSLVIHYGLIASGNKLMKNAFVRDQISAKHGVLCFEMEAAGLMNNFRCLVIRGICDYSDTHKNKSWQGFAAMAAAAYAKDLLNRIPPTMVQYEKKLGEILGEVAEQVGAIQLGVESLEADRSLEKIREWLSPSDPSTNVNKALGLRHQGSGQWFLQSEAYSAWRKEPNSFLWLHGIPGCGKTILSSTIVEDLQRDSICSQNLLYFYFDFTDIHKQSLENAIRSIISQLYFQREDVRKTLDSLYSSCRGGRTQPSIELLHMTLQDMIEQAGEVWVVLDALDECTTRKERPNEGLLSWLRRLLGLQSHIHLLVTSRPEEDIRSAIQCWARDENVIQIRSDLIEADIQAYVFSCVRESKGLSRWQFSPDVQREIEAALLTKADGMFRWVSCQLDVLEDCLDYPTVETALANLPATLDEAYARILANVPREYEHHTKRILQFLTYSERPLRLEEAVDMIAVNPTAALRFDPKHRMPNPEEISKYCSSLAVIVTRQSPTTKERVVEIQLAHLSVKEYLVSNRLIKNMVKDFQETTARASIAYICLTYLLNLNYNLSPHEIRQKFAFAQFSAQYWTSHAIIAESNNESVHTIETEFFSCRNAYETCYRLHNPDEPWRSQAQELETPAPALYYASLGGLTFAIQKLLDQGADVNAQGGRYGTALQAASVMGHGKAVQMLLDKGANVNVNALGGHYGTALQAASIEGHEKVVQILLDKGANVDANAQDGEHGSALQAASDGGHENVVQILLDNGADVNVQGGRHGTALQAASFRNHQKVLQMLLDSGADINVQGGQFGPALQAASYRGLEKVVQILLDNGANVNANKQGGRFGTALQAASCEGHKNIVHILLERGADVNVEDGDFGTALQGASYDGRENVIQVLLDNGADINAQNGAFGTALQAASVNGHEKVVQILLDKDADVNVQGGHFGTALQGASSEGHEKIVQMLLDKGADVNAQCGDFSTALQAASYRGRKRIVQILLDKGANVNAQGGRYDTALQAASVHGFKDIIQMLLDEGAVRS